MGRFNQYDSNKESGVDWIGQVPERWAIRKLKSIVNLKSGDTINHASIEEIGLYPVYGGNGLRGFANSYTHCGAYVLIGRQGALCGNVHLVNGTFWASEHAIVVTLIEKVDIKWLAMLLQAMNLNRYSESAAQPGISVEKIKNLFVCIPEYTEQTLIANFLDKKTAEIDLLIADKEKLIALLEQQRQSIITEAVTKGLNPNVKMKDSGTEWIGVIPEHWETLRIKFVLSQTEYGISESGKGEGEYKILTMGNISNGEIIIPTQGALNELDEKYLLSTSDLLFNRTNSLEQVAKVGIFRGTVDDKVTFASYLVRLRANEKADCDYLNYLLNSYMFLHYARSFAIPSISQANLNANRYTNLKIVVPPKHEQIAIVEKIKAELRRINELSDEINMQIQKIKEYRQALIFEAVTGKIDVREVAAEVVTTA